MTRDELKVIMKYFQTAYKTFYENANLTEVMDVWYDAFKDTDKAVIQLAAKNYVLDNEYPPTIAGLKKQIDLIAGNDDKAELWKKIVKAAGNSTSQDVYDALPEVCKKFVGGRAGLKELGQTDPGTLNTVVKGQFYKQADELIERENVQLNLPPALQDKLKAAGLIEERRDNDRAIL